MYIASVYIYNLYYRNYICYILDKCMYNIYYIKYMIILMYKYTVYDRSKYRIYI